MIPLRRNELQEIGKIKIGGLGEERTSKNKKKYRMPTKLDHFIVTRNDRDQSGNLVIDEDVMSQLEPNPKEIDVNFLFPDIAGNWDSYYAFYSGRGGKVFCRSDDTTKASRVNTTQDEKGKQVISHGRNSIPCPAQLCPFFGKDDQGNPNGCKPHGSLSVILPQSKTIGGVYKLRTTSWNTINNIQSQLMFFHELTRGMLNSLTYTLKIFPKEVKYNQGGVVKTSKAQVVGLFYSGDIKELYEDARTYSLDVLKGKRKLISIASDVKRIGEYNDDPEMVEEFHPEKVVNDMPEVPGEDSPEEDIQEKSEKDIEEMDVKEMKDAGLLKKGNEISKSTKTDKVENGSGEGDLFPY